MANRHYDENGVVRMLSKNPFVTVDTVNKSITYSEGTGIHTFGKIDYLVNYHQYHARKGNATRVAPTNSEYTINKQGIEDRITFIKLMIDLVNKKIEQENN
jgi:hypothetical protein